MPWLILACVFFTGCASAPIYQPTVQFPREGAQVRGVNIFGIIHPTDVWVEKVDGREVRDRHWIPQNLVLIDPGCRRLSLRGTHKGFWTKEVGRVELTAELQANHDYQVQFERNGKLMTFWVEDAITHAPVSERKIITAITHFDPPPVAPVYF